MLGSLQRSVTNKLIVPFHMLHLVSDSWNQLRVSLHQPHPSLSSADSSLPIPVTSSCSVDSPLSSSVTPSLSHSRLKTYIFHKSFLPQTLCLQDSLHGLFTCTVSFELYRFLFLVYFSLFFSVYGFSAVD